MDSVQADLLWNCHSQSRCHRATHTRRRKDFASRRKMAATKIGNVGKEDKRGGGRAEQWVEGECLQQRNEDRTWQHSDSRRRR